jgi:hypothetical protein
MIKAHGVGLDGNPVFVLGLSDGNLTLLRKGQPIMLDLAQLGGVGSVVIFWGRTEIEMAGELTKHFNVTGKTDG